MEKKSNRKEWVKNVAIIFLSVMLVLTFFSNTIMNYSLPEVATAMIEPGSITAKIRGTGNLTSDDPYKITIQESRKIASVAVKQGDVVEKDQILFYLEDEDSAELEEAEKALDELILAYSSSILKGDISNEAYQNIQGGKVSADNEYQARITAAKQKVEDAEATVESLEKQIKLSQNGDSGVIDTNAELEKAKLKLTEYGERKAEAQNAITVKKAELSALESGSLEVLNNELSTAVLDEGIKKTAYESARKEFFDKINNVAGIVVNPNSAAGSNVNTDDVNDSDSAEEIEANNIDNTYASDSVSLPDATNLSNESQNTPIYLEDDFEANATKLEYMKELADRAKIVDGANAGATDSATTKLGDLQKAYNAYIDAKAQRIAAEEKVSVVNAGNSKKVQLQNELAELEKKYWEADQKYDDKEDYIEELTNQINNAGTNKEKTLAGLNEQLIAANVTKATAEEELSQLLTDISSELNLGNQNSIIREQREKIAKLRENAVGAVITAPIAGTITNIYKIAGETITPNEELAIMQPEGKGFSMSFSVTPEQAKKVTVGEKAEIQNSWYYNDITATLVGIRPDPESNGTKKLLVFNVAGDVQAGQSVSVSIGQKSANYDLLVPNSAVREDNNGKFILMIEAKNSPLGNRYIATRVDVEVLGSDDHKTAISAPLYGYEYVITTATQPVEAGKQVRLAEN